jgi:hypothetical protein
MIVANNNNNKDVTRLYNNRELLRILNIIKNKNITQLEPSFEPGFGFSYQLVQNYSLEEQILFCESCTKSGLFNSKPSMSLLNCPYCSSLYFCTKLVCSLCKSSNFVRGTAIEHDLCGNINFDYEYIKSDGSLICEKCNKRLKAIGIDYSKIGYFYKCLECKAMLSNIDQQYVCLKCARSYSESEVKILRLFTYTVRIQKLDEKLSADNFLVSIIEELDKISIRSKQSETVTGKSGIKYTFPLVVFDDMDLPFVVVDAIQLGEEYIYRGKGEGEEQETFVLSFIAKCLDAQISNKILITLPYLKENVRELININQIVLIELKNTKNAVSDLSQTIIDIYNKTKQSNYKKSNE